MWGAGGLGERAGTRLARVLRDAPTSVSNVRGILFMTAACASFACGDTIMKLSAGQVPTSELLFLRGSFVTVGGLLVAMSLGSLSILHRALSKAMALRAAGDVTGAWSFQLALARMPYADLTAVGQLIPLSITAASALFLGEKVGWRRWTATMIGLLGVLLIIRPGSSAFNWWALAGLVSVLASTVRDLGTRFVDRGVPPPIIMMLSAGATTLTSLLAAPFSAWSSPSATLVLSMAAAAMFSLFGQICVIISVRSADISAVAPFRYTIILFAIASGVLVFGQFPDSLTLVGTAIVVAAGLYTFYREQSLRRLANRPRPR
jgi:drug/metabolite transporter (DMT)-like permease